jgi:4-amino-4-deoxy-L-arabinose transferase-like glycosyltransferase
MPGFFFALLGCATTALLARQLFDKETAVYATLAALTFVLPVALGQSPTHDVALVPWINLLVYCFWMQLQSDRDRGRWAWTAIASVFIALALLTKGLIGIAIVGSGIVLYVVVTNSIRWSLLARCCSALFGGCLLASPWFLSMEAASRGYLFYYFVERHFLGFVTEGQEHGQMPWHYYLAPVLGGAMPWLLYAIATAAQALRERTGKTRNHGVLLLVCWFVAGFLFLSLAGSKLLTYSLPLFPPVAILAGVCFRAFFRNELAPKVRAFVIGSFRLSSIFGIVAPAIALMILQLKWNCSSPAAAYVVAIAGSIIMAFALYLFERGQKRLALGVGTLWFPVIFSCLITWPTQVLADQYSQRALAHEVAAVSRAGMLLIAGERIGSVIFYLPPADRQWYRDNRAHEIAPNDIQRLSSEHHDAFIAVSSKKLHDLQNEGDVVTTTLRAGKFFVVASPPRL